MAQFDVHANRGARRADVPYVVLVQSALFDSYRRRVVVPLVRRQAVQGQVISDALDELLTRSWG